jgi:hypothetical protein
MHNLISTVEVDSVLPANPAAPSGAVADRLPPRGRRCHSTPRADRGVRRPGRSRSPGQDPHRAQQLTRAAARAAGQAGQASPPGRPEKTPAPGCGPSTSAATSWPPPGTAGEISRKEWATAKRVLDQQAAQLTSRLSSSAQALALAQFAALDGDMWQRWEHPQMTTSARRALIQACVTGIKVNPASPGRRWDPDRIQPDWIA